MKNPRYRFAAVCAAVALCGAVFGIGPTVAADGGDDLALVTIDYPEDGSLFPPDLAPPTVLWHDDSAADAWRFEVLFQDGSPSLAFPVPGGAPPQGEIDPRCIAATNEIYQPTPYQASAESHKPTPEAWATILRHSAGRPASVTISGYRAEEPSVVISRGKTTWTTSKDPVGAPIFYRDVPLMPSATKEGEIKPLDQTAQPLIAWRLRDVARDESRVLLRDMPTCANCHSFSSDGSTLAMDIDGPGGDKGAYGIVRIQPNTVIRNEQVMTWNAFGDKPQGHHTLGFLSRISPDGNHVVTTVNEALYVQNFTDHKFSQVFYPTRGILAWYSRQTEQIQALPGADDPEFVHCDPVFTPDGKQLVFARAVARDPYERGRPAARYAGDPNETPIRYDLYRMPFDEGRGGTPQRIVGASDNGMSNSFPKVSPDGKWIVYVRSANGQLMRPDGKLWIVPSGGGKARPLSSNRSLMNSWHSFSPNGRWLVFSSKANTPYTQMFLTHIDEQGNDSPALLVENSTAANRAVNIPEFVNIDYEAFESISVPAVDHYQYFSRGNQLAREGKTAEAIAAYELALSGESVEWRVNNWRIHESLSKVLLSTGDLDRALVHIVESLTLNPNNGEMRSNLAFVLVERGRPQEALEHLEIAVQLMPQDPLAHFNLATLRLQLGDPVAAVEDYGRAIELAPDDPAAWLLRGAARQRAGEPVEALRDVMRALELAPADWPRRPDALALQRQLEAPVD